MYDTGESFTLLQFVHRHIPSYQVNFDVNQSQRRIYVVDFLGRSNVRFYSLRLSLVLLPLWLTKHTGSAGSPVLFYGSLLGTYRAMRLSFEFRVDKCYVIPSG
jgi:hypothetical protein